MPNVCRISYIYKLSTVSIIFRKLLMLLRYDLPKQFYVTFLVMKFSNLPLYLLAEQICPIIISMVAELGPRLNKTFLLQLLFDIMMNILFA